MCDVYNLEVLYRLLIKLNISVFAVLMAMFVIFRVLECAVVIFIFFYVKGFRSCILWFV